MYFDHDVNKILCSHSSFNRPHPPHEPHPISELRRGGVYPPQAGKSAPSRGREILVIAQKSPPLVPVLRSPARGGTEDGAGVRACPVLDTGGGGSKRTLASKYGDAAQGLGGSEKFFVFLLQ